jgi:lipopolysaccharide transport system permease protein
MAYVVRAYRQVLLSQQIPSLADVGVLAAYGVTAFLIGGLVFRHLKRGFADVL